MRPAMPFRTRAPAAVWDAGAESILATSRSTAANQPGLNRRSAEVGASAAISETDVDVVVVVGLREARSTEAEERDDLLRLNLGREPHQRLDRALGDSADALVPRDRQVLHARDVDREPEHVSRDDLRAGEEAVAGDQARDAHLAESDDEVADDDEDTDVHASGDDVARTRGG